MNKEKNIKKNFSFDDLEVEKLKKEKLPEALFIKKTKDDLDISYAQDAKEKTLEEPVEKKSKVSQAFKKISTLWNKFTQSKVGKVLFSNSLSYAISLGGAAIAVSGLFTPVSPLIIAVASVAVIGVGVNAVIETLKVHNLRKLHKENNLLIQYRNAKAEQDYILLLEPNLSEVLKDELSILPKKEHDLNNVKYKTDGNKLKSTGSILANNISGLAYTATSGLSGNVIDILKATGYGIITSVSLITSGLSEKERIEIKNIFKTSINEECKKSDTPDYQNLKQLEKSTKEQILQTLILKKLITDKDYWSMNDKDKKEKFQEIRDKFIFEIRNNGFNNFCSKNKVVLLNTEKEGYTKDIKRIMNPFYESPNTALKPIPLAHKVGKNKNQSMKYENKTITR
ncbi:MAG: hypothetical protein RCO49_04140 [Rickettsia endosymbiont of Argas persicus]